MSPTDEQTRIEQLEQRIDGLENELEEKNQRIEELEAEVKTYREQNERDKAAVKRRVTDLENRTAESNGRDDAHDVTTAEESPRQVETPLTQIVQLPEPIAQQELTANQERARFIAKDVLDYATKVPAGFVVTSSDIRTILAAKENGTPHTETVSRVMNYLDRFGQDDIEIVTRHGKRRAVFTEEAATRCHHADARHQNDITAVVMEATAG